MYKIKEKPEDFIVDEVPSYQLDKEGIYAYFWLKKKDKTTMQAVQILAEKLKIKTKNIGFAGTKDKKAVTAQTISIPSKFKEKAESIQLKDISLEFIGNGKKPISLGDLKGNEFTIRVNGLDSKEYNSPKKVPNYFGPQRFSKNNAEIGKLIVKKDFRKAAELMSHEEVDEHLKKKPNDLVGAIKKIPLKIRKIYIHAYQSKLWNDTVQKYVKESHPEKNIKVPITGFATELKKYPDKIKKIIQDILKKEDISLRDFIIPQIKELSSPGEKRDLFIYPEDFMIRFAEEKERYAASVSFFLPKGSYATVVIDHLFNKG